MSDDQLATLFVVKRDGEGNAVIKPPAAGAPPSERQAFDSQCYLCGITDPERVTEVWAARQSRRAKPAPLKKGKRKGRR